MLDVRVDGNLKVTAAEKLVSFGLTVSDAVRILLTRAVKEGGLPAELTVDEQTYDDWFREGSAGARRSASAHSRRRS
jgi:DNA-damage-inducible protein J